MGLQAAATQDGSIFVEEQLLVTRGDKATYWGGWALAVVGTVILGAAAVALAPATIIITVATVAITAKAAVGVGTGIVVFGMSLQAYGGRPQ